MLYFYVLLFLHIGAHKQNFYYKVILYSGGTVPRTEEDSAAQNTIFA
jgi:hypothetical protein